MTPAPAPIAASPPDRANAFDALRCLLAIFVLYSHTFLLGGYQAEPFLVWAKGQTIIGQLAVLGFFGLSGYLVTASCTRSRSLYDYLGKRVRRIIPGLWACVVVTAFVLAPTIYFLRQGTVAGFVWFGDGGALTYATSNLAIRMSQSSIPAVLDGAPYGGSLNGSLWSLWPETLCYLIVAALSAAGMLAANRVLLLVGTGALLLFHAAHTLLPSVDSPLLPTWLVLIDQARYFLAYLVGTVLWVWRDRLQPNWPTALLLGLTLAALGRLGGLQLLSPVFVPLFLIVLGQCFTLHLRHDLSYGLYIYGFPVQQLLATSPVGRSSWPFFFIASVALTGVLAFLSWRFVESPFLRRRSAATSPPRHRPATASA